MRTGAPGGLAAKAVPPYTVELSTDGLRQLIGGLADAPLRTLDDSHRQHLAQRRPHCMAFQAACRALRRISVACTS